MAQFKPLLDKSARNGASPRAEASAHAARHTSRQRTARVCSFFHTNAYAAIRQGDAWHTRLAESTNSDEPSYSTQKVAQRIRPSILIAIFANTHKHTYTHSTSLRSSLMNIKAQLTEILQR